MKAARSFDKYTELEALPAYAQLGDEDFEEFAKREDVLKWTGAEAPPPIGTKVFVRVNRIGAATVRSYFCEHGWLGLKVKPLDPPDWYVKQNGFGSCCHVFGAEIGERSPRATR